MPGDETGLSYNGGLGLAMKHDKSLIDIWMRGSVSKIWPANTYGSRTKPNTTNKSKEKARINEGLLLHLS